MRINKFFSRYVAMERTPSIGGGVIASGATRGEAIMLCMQRKVAALKQVKSVGRDMGLVGFPETRG